MKLHFLGSGSQGNCTLVETDHGRVLIDVGFGLRETTARLAAAGYTIDQIDAAILTHTHTDHVKGPMLRRLSKSNIPLYCRPEHVDRLAWTDGYSCLKGRNLVRTYTDDRFELLDGLTVEPLALSHDAPATHGFLFERTNGQGFRFAYVADCGWHEAISESLVRKIRDTDLIALEFNHDEEMERTSGRPYFLVERVLGPYGHLSNVNAARLLDACRSRHLKHVVQLHLSRECNHPRLAREAAAHLAEHVPVHQTCQDTIGPVIEIT